MATMAEVRSSALWSAAHKAENWPLTQASESGYTGSHSAMYRFIQQLVVDEVPEVPMRLAVGPFFTREQAWRAVF